MYAYLLLFKASKADTFENTLSDRWPGTMNMSCFTPNVVPTYVKLNLFKNVQKLNIFTKCSAFRTVVHSEIVLYDILSQRDLSSTSLASYHSLNTLEAESYCKALEQVLLQNACKCLAVCFHVQNASQIIFNMICVPQISQ